MEKLKKIIDDPNQLHELQIPKQISNKILEIRSVPLDTAACPTIIIASQTAGYNAVQFKRDVEKVTAYFKLKNFQVAEILLKPIKPEFSDVVDSADAAKQMEDAVEFVSRGTMATRKLSQAEMSHPAQNLTRLRIVHLGVSYSKLFFQALEYLLNNWESQEKSVQFVTKGDDEHYKKLRFWKTACINNLVSKVEYINLSEYLPFGYYHDGKGVKLNADPDADDTAKAAASSRDHPHAPQ